MTAHPHVASAKIIFEPAIDALGGAALVVAHVLGKLAYPRRPPGSAGEAAKV